MQKNKRSLFTENENKIILDMVKDLGEDWDAIAKKLPNRTPKQCHDRYYNYLRDGLKKEPWSKHEDETLLHLFNEIGPKWSKMMNQLPGRSGNDIKNRWHKHLVKVFNSNSANIKTPNLSKNNLINDFPMLMPSNSNFNLQLYFPPIIPTVQFNQNMVPINQNDINFNSSNFFSDQFHFQQNQLNFRFPKIENKIPIQTKKCLKIQNRNEIDHNIKDKSFLPVSTIDKNTVQIINKVDIDDHFIDPIPTSSTEKADIFSTFNMPDIEIQEFFDTLGHANIDFYAML